jgi:hypothetical protein
MVKAESLAKPEFFEKPGPWTLVRGCEWQSTRRLGEVLLLLVREKALQRFGLLRSVNLAPPLSKDRLLVSIPPECD